MGSWSVYCTLSRIAITAGDEAVLIPLKKNDSYSGYDKYVPATLPIFGTYNDYGSIEDVVKDKNTELIESCFGCTIEDFVAFIVGVRRDFNDEYSDWHKKEHLKYLEDWEYMWVNRQVFDFLSTHCPNGYGMGEDFNLGKDYIMSKMGFEYLGTESDKASYNRKYKAPNGEISYSDGTWIEGQVYELSTIEDKYGADISYFKGKSIADIYDLMDKKERLSEFGHVIGLGHNDIFSINIEEQYVELLKDNPDALKSFSSLSKKYKNTNVQMYIDNIMDNCIIELLSKLRTIRTNMYNMSTSWEPYIQYITPQCGEKELHQKILEKFADINRETISDTKYEDD